MDERCFTCGGPRDSINKRQVYCKACKTERERKYRAVARRRYADYQKAYRVRLKKSVIDAYGGQCNCCGTDILDFLNIDHIDNDGAQHRLELEAKSDSTKIYRYLEEAGYPKDKFQVLCRNCNWAKFLRGRCNYHDTHI